VGVVSCCFGQSVGDVRSPLQQTNTIRRDPLHRPMFGHKLLLDVMGLMRLALLDVARWSVQGSGLLGCVLGFTGGVLHQTHIMSRGQCGCASRLWSALGTMVGMLCVVDVVADCGGA